MRDLSSFLHLFIDPIIFISVGWWIFILYFVLSNPTLLILLPKLFQPYELFCLTPVFFWYIPITVEGFHLILALTFYTPGLSCIFHVPGLESAIYQMSSGFKIWVPGLLNATRVLLLLGPLSWQCKKNIHIYLYTHTHMHTDICVCIYITHLSIYMKAYIHTHTYKYICTSICISIVLCSYLYLLIY